jgi:prophage regulatory protein
MNTINQSTDEVRLVSIKTACALTSLSRTAINRYRAEGRFPAAVSLGDRRVAFVKSEVNDWIAARISARVANDRRPAAGESWRAA